ncbi:hypothetical protein FRC01_010404 [Tulasnella sp. 417]|nr:hypothetical protein FRC01_010404 [Tulasnella sp. 417]
MDARALSVALVGLSAATQVLAAPTNVRRGFALGGWKYNKVSKKKKMILIAVLCPLLGLLFLGLIIYIIWVKKDIGEKLRDRYTSWRMKRDVRKAVDKLMKDLDKELQDPPSGTAAETTGQPNSSTQNDNGRDNLAVPSSPNSKAATDASTPEENQQQQQQPPPYTETADITMPEPAHIRSQPDPNAPVPYTRELAP